MGVAPPTGGDDNEGATDHQFETAAALACLLVLLNLLGLLGNDPPLRFTGQNAPTP